MDWLSPLDHEIGERSVCPQVSRRYCFGFVPRHNGDRQMQIPRLRVYGIGGRGVLPSAARSLRPSDGYHSVASRSWPSDSVDTNMHILVVVIGGHETTIDGGVERLCQVASALGFNPIFIS